MKLKRNIFSGLLCTALLAAAGVAAEAGEIVGPMQQKETVIVGPQKIEDSDTDAADSAADQAEEEVSENTSGISASDAAELSAEDSVQSGSNSAGQSAEVTEKTAETAGQAAKTTGTASENAGQAAETIGQTTESSVQTGTDSLEGKITAVSDTVTVASDCDVLDYPGRKDGTVIGEVLEQDEISRTGTIDDIWSRIVFQDDSGQEQVGYIPSSVLVGYEADPASDASADDSDGSLHEGSGEGIFSDAIDGVTSVNGSGTAAEGVVTGTPVSASSDASLVDLGIFKITHYCPCSICCGPYADGVTATGVTAVTNHTIAVDPTVIPYGTKVVINGQVYVAEDCGGAIKGKRIDIYVGSHAEGEEKGTFNAEVYILQES